jgi:hypothetical protein
MKLWLSLALLVQIAAAQAQPHQPYAGLQANNIKALPPQQEADLKAGRGMGLALAAELNGYPGPLHALELAKQLELTDAQRAAMKRLLETMKMEAILLGVKLVAQETYLDRLFADRSITPESLARATADIGATQGALRNTHLKFHLATAEIMTADQIRRYAELRGYAGAPASHHNRQH